MNEFANVLSEIIERGKQQEGEKITIKKIAQYSGITASYISNLKLGHQDPPSQKKLLQLTDALRSLGVAEREIQRLVNAYNRMQSGDTSAPKLLASLIDEAQKDGGKLLERIAQGVRMEGQERLTPPQRSAAPDDEPLVELIKGDRRASLKAAIRFIERAQSAVFEGRAIYLTWFQYTRDPELESVRERLRTLLRQVLWEYPSCHLYHLWAGDAAQDMSAIVAILTHYLGASNCYLYEVPDGQRIPEYLVIEGFGFVEARPASPDSWWIRTVIVPRADLAQANELQAVNDYMEFLLGAQASRKPPLIQTETSKQKYSLTLGMKNLANAEKHWIIQEHLLFKPCFSARYRTCDTLRLKLESLEFSADRIDCYLHNHQERIEALRELEANGMAKMIHQRQFLGQELSMLYAADTTEDTKKTRLRQIEIALLKEQIIGVLQAIKNNSNVHVALCDENFSVHCEIANDIAFLYIETATAQDQLPFERDGSGSMAWTLHPDVVFQLRKEFDAKWQAIDELWRTDTEAGRKNVVNFIVTESLKALVKADAPTQELWKFMYALIDNAPHIDNEAFLKELFTHEQAAKEIVVVCMEFPYITMPLHIGHWESKSFIRTRQALLDRILKNVKHFKIISNQASLEAYWNTHQYAGVVLKGSWTEQHFQRVHELLLEFPQSFIMEIIPTPEKFMVDFEIIDQEFVLMERDDVSDEGGIVLQDKEFAEALLTYVDRNLSAKCPEHLKGSRNVAAWLEERFLKQRTE